jgi:two-component system, LytTR family, response regulator
MRCLAHALRVEAASAVVSLLDPRRKQNWKAHTEIRGRLVGEISSLSASLARRRDRLILKTREGWIPFRLRDILRISAAGKHVCLRARGGAEHVVRSSLRELEARLDPERFVQVHRSDIVPLHAVAKLQGLTHGDAILELVDGTSLVLTRTYRAQFLRLFRGSALGSQP